MIQFLDESLENILKEGELARMILRIKSEQLESENGSWDSTYGDTRSEESLYGDANSEEFPRQMGPFKVLSEIGQGGMGKVYLAIQDGANRKVALKVIRQELLGRKNEKCGAIAARFRVEAQAAAQIQHENVVPVYEVGEVEGQAYYSMLYVEGQSLSAHLKNQGPLTPRRAAEVVEQISNGLASIHQVNMLHRDIKPSNILLSENGKVMLTDFGLVKWTDGSADLKDETRTGTLLGTLAYMSPEQALDATNVGEASDIYSLGAVLYQCLTGVPPFPTTNHLELLRLIGDEPPVAPRLRGKVIPRDLETITQKCLEKRPDDRYRSATELAQDLDRFLNHYPIVAKRVSWHRRLKMWSSRNRVAACLVVAMGGMLLLWAVTNIFSSQQNYSSQTRLLAESMMSAKSSEIPLYIAKLDERRITADDFDPPKSLEAEFRTNLALLPVEPNRIESIAAQIPALSSEEIGAFQSVLVQRTERFENDRLVQLLASQDPPTLQAAAIVAKCDATNPFLVESPEDLSKQLLRMRLVEIAHWTDKLLPASDELTEPLFGELGLESDPQRRAKCTLSIAALNQERFEILFRLLALAHPQDLQHVWRYFSRYREKLVCQIELQGNGASDQLGEFQKVNFALALLKYSKSESAYQPLGEWEPDGLQIPLSKWLSDSGIEATILIEELPVLSDPNQIYGTLIALADYNFENISTDDLTLLREHTVKLFNTHRDPGVHAVAGWILKTNWKEIYQPPRETPDDANWRYECGHLLAEVSRPAKLTSRWADARSKKEKVFQLEPFEIGAFEVTSGQFRSFMETSQDFSISKATLSKDPHVPVKEVSYVTAARYCNWLSEQAGLPKSELCYEVVSEREVRFVENYESKNGFRLPTETEWEYACCNGHNSETFFQLTKDNLKKYSWNLFNSNRHIHPVGELRPNRMGMFDIFGNVGEVVRRVYRESPEEAECSKGGHCLDHEGRFSRRINFLMGPDVGKTLTGFRIARSLHGD